MNATTYDVYAQARSLNYDEQLRLLSLSGLGAHHWRDVNIDEYLNGERAW